MAGFIIGLFSVILVLISIFVMLIILMQRPSANAGMGSSLGGGIAESAFGGESMNVLTRWTIYCIAAFFIIAFGLYLFYMSRMDMNVGEAGTGLPEITMTEATPLEPEEQASRALIETPAESTGVKE